MKYLLGHFFLVFGIHSVLGKNFTVTSVLEDQYLIDNGDGTYSGYMVDLLEALSKRAGFSYEIQINPDGLYGSKNSMGQWTGMLGELLDTNEDVHIAAAPLLITEERRSAVPLTIPFQNVGHRIIITKPVVEFHSIKVLFQPFSLQLWIMVIVICIIVTALLFIVNKFSPSEWSKVQPEDDPTNARESFAPKNAFFFVHSTLTWQGYKEAPRSPAGRILVSMWFSFIFFMVIAYISNLTAFLIARPPEKPVVPFKTWQEMTSQSTVMYGLKTDGSLYRNMKDSTDPTLKHAIQNIETYVTNFDTYENGIKKVRSSDGLYAAIVPTDVGLKYIEAEPCDLMFVGAKIADMHYGMACKTDDICKELTVALIEERESGGLFSLRQKWFSSLNRCPSANLANYISKQETAMLTARPLTIADASLAFVVLLIGIIFCVVFLIIEVVVTRRRKGEMSMPKKEGQKNNTTDVEQARLTDEQEKAPIAKNEA